MLYYMFNKPQQCVTACSDTMHKTVMDYFPAELAGSLHPVGRLDKDTCGLLLLTDDGSLDQKLMQPEMHVSKTYFFYAIGQMNAEKIKRLEGGISLDGFTARTATFQLGKIYQVQDLADFIPADCRQRYLKNPNGAAFSGRLTIHEGKKHEVKLMLRAVGCKIFYLRRDRIGGLPLDTSLPPGGFRPLTKEELGLLLSKA